MVVPFRFAAAVAVVWVSAAMSGCGSGSDPQESSGSGTATPAAASPTPAATDPARSADAFGGATTTTATPAPSAPATAADPIISMSDAAAAAGVLTPQTNDLTESTDPACYKAAVTVCQLERAILKLTNAHRDAAAQLTLDPDLSFVARGWSAAQQAAGAIGHAGFPEGREATYLAEFGAPMPFFLGAENVGTTYGTDKLTVDHLASEIVDLWWNSAGHRANILGAYGVIGVGVSISADARTVMATQLFGAP